MAQKISPAMRETKLLSSLSSLPIEVLLLILEWFDVTTLCRVAQTCSALKFVIDGFWNSFNRKRVRWSPSLFLAQQVWTPPQQARFVYLSDKAWQGREFNSVTLNRPWLGNPHPVMALTTSRLVVIAGQRLESHGFLPPIGDGGGTRIRYEGDGSLDPPMDRRRDVTGLAFAPDHGMDRTLIVSRADGKLLRYRMDMSQNRTSNLFNIDGSRRSLETRLTLTGSYPHPPSHITHLASSQNTILTLAALRHRSQEVEFGGLASLYQAHRPWAPPHTISLPHKPRSALLSLQSSTPFIVVGSATKPPAPNNAEARPTVCPLSVYGLAESQLLPTPHHFLASGSNSRTASAVYALSGTSPGSSSPFGGSSQVILSGWFDGDVRVHDLRSDGRLCSPATLGAQLKPVLTFRDPWLDSSVYSLGMGGGNGAYIVAGMGQHGILAIYDVRKPFWNSHKGGSSPSSSRAGGCSAYSPGGDHTPVYALKVEGSRIWGATNRTFLFDFGPSREDERGETGRNSFGGEVRTKSTIYSHRVVPLSSN